MAIVQKFIQVLNGALELSPHAFAFVVLWSGGQSDAV